MSEEASAVGLEESELRVLLLYNNDSERRKVLNLVLGNSEPYEPEHCSRLRVPIALMKKKEMVVEVSPELLFSETTEKMIESFVSHCNLRPHIFLLALQPEDVSDQQQKKISNILDMFSKDSFHRSVILLLSPLQQSFERCQQNMQCISKMIQKCQNRVLCQQNFEHSELVKVFNDILEGNHVEPQSNTLKSKASPQQQKKEEKSRKSFNVGSSLRILLLGENKQSQANLCEHLHESWDFKWQFTPMVDQSCALLGWWRGTSVSLVTIANIYDVERNKVKQLMKECVSLCCPGPNLLLLLVQPSTFTEKKRHRLMFILGLFGKEAFQRSLVVTANGEDQTNVSVDRLLATCGGHCLYVIGEDVGEFMEKLESVIREKDGSLSLGKMSSSEEKNVALNLILCGSNRKLKDLFLRSFSKQPHHVCELTALSEESQMIVMEKSFQCVSQYQPQAVHAFILVLPAGNFTDEDTQEIEMLQKIFGPEIFNFTLIVFSMESGPIPPDLNILKTDEEILKLCNNCGGRSDVFNLTDRNQIPELMDMMAELSRLQPSGYTTETFAHVQIKKNLQQENLIKELQEKLQKSHLPGVEEIKSPDCLRIVLFGKTGSGKSSAGNTILGGRHFSVMGSFKSVTMHCEKVKGEVDGRPVFVVDTPGLFDKSLSNDQVYEELVKCISLLSPGPHVFLLVLPIGRFTQEDEETLKLLKKGFGKNADKFIIVLFTKGDTLKRDQRCIKDYIEESDNSFKKMISDYGERFHVFDNYEEKNRGQVSELIKKIDAMVKVNGGECFTNDMLQEAEAAIQKEAERILKKKEKEMKRESQELGRKHKAEIHKITKRIVDQRAEIDRERNLRQKQLKEKEDIINQLEKTMQEQQKKFKEEGKKRIEIEKLKDEYKLEKEKLERETKEEERRLKQEEENQRKELEEKHLMSVQQMKVSYEEKARKQAEESNEFKEKYTQELKELQNQIKNKDKKLTSMQLLSIQDEKQMKEKHYEEIRSVVQCVAKTRGNIKTFRDLLERQKKEIESQKNPAMKEKLQRKHEEEIAKKIQEMLKPEDKSRCAIM